MHVILLQMICMLSQTVAKHDIKSTEQRNPQKKKILMGPKFFIHAASEASFPCQSIFKCTEVVQQGLCCRVGNRRKIHI